MTYIYVNKLFSFCLERITPIYTNYTDNCDILVRTRIAQKTSVVCYIIVV